MKYFEFNLNYDILVKITDVGIKHYVVTYNKIRDFEDHLSFNEFKKQADSNGYHTMQTTKFLHYFCELGMNITNYVELIVLFKEKDLESFDYDSSTRIPGVPKENRLNIK